MVASNPFVLPFRQQSVTGYDYDLLVASAEIPAELRGSLVKLLKSLDDIARPTKTAQASELETWAFRSLRLTEVQATAEPPELGQIEAKLIHLVVSTDASGYFTVAFEKPFSTQLVGAVTIWAEASGATTAHVIPDLGAGSQSTVSQIRFRMFDPTGAAIATPSSCRFCALVFGW